MFLVKTYLPQPHMHVNVMFKY